MDRINQLGDLLVKNIKSRDNEVPTALQVGEVVSVNPIKIKWGEHIILSESNLYISKMFTDGIPYKTNDQYMDTNGNMHTVQTDQLFKIDLSIGDKVSIAPESSAYKKWFMIGLL